MQDVSVGNLNVWIRTKLIEITVLPSNSLYASIVLDIGISLSATSDNFFFGKEVHTCKV